MNNNLVSVIIPVYNTEKYLDKCVDSVVNQTYKNLEIILIDDGSTDSSPEICDKWAEIDSRIKVIHKENGGVSSAKNTGIDNSTGNYIGFVDSDDYIDNNMFQTLFNIAKNENCDVVCCGMIFEYVDSPNRKVYDNNFTLTGKDILKNYILDNLITPENANKLYSKELFNGIRFDNSIAYAEDLQFNYKIMKNAKSVSGTDECMYHYIQNSGISSTTAIMTDARANSYKVIEKIMLDCKNDIELYNCAVKRFTEATSAVLSRVLLIDAFCEKYYNVICDALMSYKNDILKNSYVTKRHKILLIAISVNRKLFKTIIKKLRKFHD